MNSRELRQNAVAGTADIAVIMENSLSAASPFLIFLTFFQNHLKEESKNTPIHMQVLFNVLMGLRRQEINAVKYSDEETFITVLTSLAMDLEYPARS